MLVTIHMARGSLHDALHGGSAAAAGLDAAWRLSFLSGLARAIQALHAANFVHRDVKGANVLVGDDGRAVLADAGVARRMRLGADATAEATGTRVIGTDGYLDPEYMDTMELTYKSDVFSVGVVILEMLTGRPARDTSARPPLLWRQFRSVRANDWDERVERVVTEAAACWGVASLTAGPVVALASLALRATAESSASRPSIDEVLSSLEEISVDGVGDEGGDEGHVRMCMVCMCEPRAMRFDCGHMTTCGGCVARWPDCLLCNDFTGLHLNQEANPRDPTYVRPSTSSTSDEDILRLWRERCPALREHWSAEADARSWKGVTFGGAEVNGTRRVVKIELCEKLGDAVEVPAELGGLGALTILDLRCDQLSSMPADLGKLSALTELYLQGNQLSSMPAELGKLNALTMLHLGRNRLSSVPAALLKLSALTTLNLEDNQLSSVPAELGKLSALTTLNLSYNQLSSVPADLGKLSALTRLHLCQP
jgi:serine/threonine protein kinase